MMVTQQRTKSIRLDYWSIVVYIGSIKFLHPFEKDVIKMVILLCAGNSVRVDFRALVKIEKSDNDFETAKACFVPLLGSNS